MTRRPAEGARCPAEGCAGGSGPAGGAGGEGTEATALAVGSLGEGTGVSGKAGLGLASVNNFSALWSMGTGLPTLLWDLTQGYRAR